MFGIGWIVSLLLKKGLSEGEAKRAAPWVAALAVFTLCAFAAGIWLHFHDKAVLAQDDARTVAKVAPAKDAAAEQRARDIIDQAKKEDQAHAAINRSGPDTRPAPAAVAHNCQRLRRAGWPESSLPPDCRP